MTRNHSKSNFIEQIQSDLSNTIDTILNHQYLDALEKKGISKVNLGIFVCEQYQIISNDKRNFAFMISRASSDVTSKLFTDCLDVELNALGNLTIMAEELIIGKRRIEAYQQLAGCQAYCSFYFSWITTVTL
jgi:thiaminase